MTISLSPGTENPAEDEDRKHVAVSNKCGGSYCITQKWIHKHDVIAGNKGKTSSMVTRQRGTEVVMKSALCSMCVCSADRTLESWVGRTKPDSVELSRKTVSSHVARMVGGTTKPDQKPFELVRHSQPYGTVAGESGLFFIG